MKDTQLFSSMALAHGSQMKNRFALAPLTNSQSHANGQLSDAEFKWLTMRAQGGFGMTMTCASHVQKAGQAFEGQLGIHSDDHIPRLTRLAAAIRAHGSLAIVQLHHAGRRALQSLVGQPVCASEDAETGARALSIDEVQGVTGDFVAAAVRAEKAGFDGVEIHGAHSYIVTQFLSGEFNHRRDRYGGSLENRSRFLLEIIQGIRKACSSRFQLGVRLSPERYGLKLAEMRDLAQQLMLAGEIDFLDLSLWDFRKLPVEPEHRQCSLMAHFTRLDRGSVRICVAGKVMTRDDATEALEEGADFVLLGRAGILHHDFPRLAREPGFVPRALPVDAAYLATQGLTPPFIEYMKNFKGFLSPVN